MTSNIRNSNGTCPSNSSPTQPSQNQNHSRCHCSLPKLWMMLLIFCYIVSAWMYSYQESFKKVELVKTIKNYFWEEKEYEKLDHIIFTPTCRIPNISAWDESIMPFVDTYKSDGCNQTRQWTFIDEMNILINISAINASIGNCLHSVSCCYRSIKRVEQSANHYDRSADDIITFGSNCIPMQNITKMEDEFVHVICNYTSLPRCLSPTINYSYFHAIALPKKPIQRSENVNTGPKDRKDKPDYRPNVVMIGLDSVSRLSFQRNMPKTRAFLHEIGAVEMLGYTKVGEHTLPNAVAFLSGYYEEDLLTFCHFNSSMRLDLCPFIWHRFHKANYLTAYLEDVTNIGAFNYLKTGFVEQPTDYYFRTFMLGVNTYRDQSTHSSRVCIGEHSTDETILQYVGDLLAMSRRITTPIFIMNWSNSAHNNINAAQSVDDTYRSFLERVNWNNTLLFFLSDHGYRHGMLRGTISGWYEDKLPNFWVYLPPTLRKQFPSWQKSLDTNSKRLTSPMDLYKTMSHLLDEFSDTKEPADEIMPNGTIVERRFGQSLFIEIPVTRTCKGTGIPDSFCACRVPLRLNINDNVLLNAAHAAIKHINKMLPRVCLPLNLQLITAGAALRNYNPSQEDDFVVYVTFETRPGDFLFEATVEFIYSEFIVKEIPLRMNSINTNVSCVHDSTLERFCYCAFLA